MMLVIWAVAIVAALVLFFRQRYSSFRRAGVNHLPPLPPAGNLTKTTFRLEHFTDTVKRTYDAFPSDRFVGHYEFVQKVVVIRDLDLVKQVTLKDFDYFVDRRIFVDEDSDAMFARSLFSLKGGKWRDMRATMSPAFTSCKMRLMVPFMTEVGDQMNQVLKDKIKASGVGYIDWDAKDLTTRYANDVIASCAFGIKTNSHADEKNEFYIQGKEASNLRFIHRMKFFGFSAFPTLMKALKISLFPQSTEYFFRSLISSVISDREQRNLIRHDMIHMLMEAKKGKLSHSYKEPSEAVGFATVEESAIGTTKTTRVWTDDDLYAQAVIFFIAGFHTVSIAMTFLMYELAMNPEVQDRLVTEIKEMDAKNGGKLDFNSIQEMVYMDMVVSEILRLWSPVPVFDRVCVKDYNLGKPNNKANKDYIIKKGEGIWIPTWALHRSEEYYPDPLKFNPERFSKENQHQIKPFTYVPFGLGPRNCNGSRFALCEIKVMVYQLLRDMELSPNDKTPVPVQLSSESFSLGIKGGHSLRISVRK